MFKNKIHPQKITLEYLEDNNLFVPLYPPSIWTGEITSTYNFEEGKVIKKKKRKIWEIFYNNKFFIRLDFESEEVSRGTETAILMIPVYIEIRLAERHIEEKDFETLEKWLISLPEKKAFMTVLKTRKQCTIWFRNVGALFFIRCFSDIFQGDLLNEHEDEPEFRRLINTFIYYYVFKHNVHCCNICKKEALGEERTCYLCLQELNSLNFE